MSDRHTTTPADAAAWERTHAPDPDDDREYADELPPHVDWHAPGTCWACDLRRSTT